MAVRLSSNVRSRLGRCLIEDEVVVVDEESNRAVLSSVPSVSAEASVVSFIASLSVNPR